MVGALLNRKILTDYLFGYLLFLLSLILFRGVLDYIYIGFINPVYEKSFLSFKLSFNVWQYTISWLSFFLCLTLVKHKIRMVSDYFFLSSVIFLLAPLTSVYGLDSTRPLYPLCVSMMAIFIVFVVSTKLPFVKVIRMPIITHGNLFIIGLSWLFVAYLVSWYIFTGAAFHLNFNLNNIYYYREFNGKLADVGFFSYLNIWTYKTFTIFLICYCLYSNKIFIFCVICSIQLFFFGVNNHKIVLFLPFLPVILWFYFRKRNNLIVFPLLLTVLSLASYALYALGNYQLPAALIVRRTFFVPAGLTFEWFNFFSTHFHVFWSDKILSFFLTYPYHLNIPHTVGEYLLSEELAANNGYISSGYAHAGLWGVLVYSLLLGYIIKFLDVMGRRGIPVWFLLAITAGPLRTLLTDSDLLTSLLSHGLIVAMFIALFFDPLLTERR